MVLSPEGTAEGPREPAKLLDCACLFWRFSPLTHVLRSAFDEGGFAIQSQYRDHRPSSSHPDLNLNHTVNSTPKS